MLLPIFLSIICLTAFCIFNAASSSLAFCSLAFLFKIRKLLFATFIVNSNNCLKVPILLVLLVDFLIDTGIDELLVLLVVVNKLVVNKVVNLLLYLLLCGGGFKLLFGINT